MGALDDALRDEQKKIDEREARARQIRAAEDQAERELAAAVSEFLKRAASTHHMTRNQKGAYLLVRGYANRDDYQTEIAIDSQGTWYVGGTARTTHEMTHAPTKVGGTGLVSLLARALLEPVK
ncbi:MAG: hypothetical protein JHC84_05355 [Solirubrobacteraceae bacterium]|nr:hypothetical protein [Solirubrobacteraceae bacterium]